MSGPTTATTMATTATAARMAHLTKMVSFLWRFCEFPDTNIRIRNGFEIPGRQRRRQRRSWWKALPFVALTLGFVDGSSSGQGTQQQLLRVRQLPNGSVLFRFPPHVSEKDLQLSISSSKKKEKSALLAEFVTPLSAGTKEAASWREVEGIYGIYNLDSSLYLAVILHRGGETENVYTSSLVSIRRAAFVLLLPLQKKRRKSARENFLWESLQQALKEHDFYFVPPHHQHDNDSRMRDVTHTLQRTFDLWNVPQNKPEKKQEQEEPDMMNLPHNQSLSLSTESTILPDKNDDEGTLTTELSTIGTNSTLTTVRAGGSAAAARVLLPPKASTGNTAHDTTSSHRENRKSATPTRRLTQNIQTLYSNEWWWGLVQEEEEDQQPPHTEEKEATATASQTPKPHRPDPRFFWNENVVRPLVQAFLQSARQPRVYDKKSNRNPYALLLNHVIPVTSAFVGVQRNITWSGGGGVETSYDEILVSRRSKYRAGTRFTRRGADDSGAVANFVETEQILSCSSSFHNRTIREVYSHVQTRGSIPLVWSSPASLQSYNPRVSIGTNPLDQARVFRNHIWEQWQLYATPTAITTPSLVLVNLVDRKGDQGRLGRTLDAVLQAVLAVYGENDQHNDATNNIMTPNIRHVWFDFHAELHGGRWDRLQNLLQEVQPFLTDHGYFCASSCGPDPTNEEWNVVQQQTGIVRTNCMDCLDRTNVVQSVFGRFILFSQLQNRVGFESPTVTSTRRQQRRFLPFDAIVAFRRKPLNLPWKRGEEAHRWIWADNADAISRLYAGTAALKGDFTRTGKRTRRGALDDGMNSLSRFYRNNFLDAHRQRSINLLIEGRE